MTDFLPCASQLRRPILRHLLWLSQAPQLVRGEAVFRPSDYFQAPHWETIRAWDAGKAALPARLTEQPRRLLGLYVEELYHCLLEDVLGWSVIARNLPIYGGGRTIGEMDFLVQNPATGAIEHHEIAIKFYLAHEDKGGLRWCGPNPADRLDLKTQRMRSHQSQLSARPEALPTLRALGIHGRVESRLFMPGYLFYPIDHSVNGPNQADPDHARGLWLFVDQIDAVRSKNLVPLDKPHWLGPWLQQSTPDDVLALHVLEQVEARQHPRLFAELEWNGEHQLWMERERYFVVPRSWPHR